MLFESVYGWSNGIWKRRNTHIFNAKLSYLSIGQNSIWHAILPAKANFLRLDSRWGDGEKMVLSKRTSLMPDTQLRSRTVSWRRAERIKAPGDTAGSFNAAKTPALHPCRLNWLKLGNRSISQLHCCCDSEDQSNNKDWYKHWLAVYQYLRYYFCEWRNRSTWD